MKQLICIVILIFAASTTKAQSDDVPRYEVGALFSSLTIVEPNRFSIPRFEDNTFRTEPGIGGRFTYNITNSVAAEGEISFFPSSKLLTSNGNDYGDYTAGRITQGLFGVKAGKRFERFGIYGKARPGFVHFSRALSGSRQVPTPNGGGFTTSFDGRTNIAVDVGGVFEFYPSRRVVTRFDIGDTVIHFKELKYPFGPITSINPLRTTDTFTLQGHTQNNFQFSAGIGVRF